jgi:LAGLIDADG endonuclease
MTKPFLGSSETTRVISFFIDDSSFGQYLAGLLDSDGCFFISKKNHISVEITLHETHVQTLFKIKKTLGFGTVSKRSKLKASRIRITKRVGVEKVIELVNGKLLTKEKQSQLIKVCSLLKSVPITTNTFSPQNAWFTGFFERKGFFSIENKYTLTVFVLQKKKDILECIQSGFHCGTISYENSWKGYKWCITDLKNLKKILEYFEKFPLFTFKKSDAITFKRLVLFKERKYHLNQSSHKPKIESLVNHFKKRKKI